MVHTLTTDVVPVHGTGIVFQVYVMNSSRMRARYPARVNIFINEMFHLLLWRKNYSNYLQ
jgi:hypothetical protein